MPRYFSINLLYSLMGILLCLCFEVKAQLNYMFVHDRDGFVNVRLEKSSTSPIVAKRYNLSVVGVDEEESTSDWAHVGEGYIPRSRLQAIPEKLSAYILENNLVYVRNIFLVAADCPEVLFLGTVINDVPKKVEGGYSPITLEFDTEYELIDINNGKQIDPHNIICPVQSVRMQEDRIVFYNGPYFFSFFRNKEDKLCMNLFSYQTYKKEKLLKKEEEEDIIRRLSKLNEVIRLYQENKLEYYSFSYEVFGLNDFDLLDKIKTLYYNGDRDFAEYRLLLDHYPLDGEGTHAMESYYMELWSYMNRGETELDKIYYVYDE